MDTKFQSKKYNYFYKITNTINGHFYYGIHSTDNLDDGYMGSGYRIKLAFKKYGIENFTKEIIKNFDTRQEASDYEMEMVTESLIKNPNCYNMKTGGDFGCTVNCVTVCLKTDTSNYFDITTEEYYKNKDKYQLTEGNKKSYIVFDKKENNEIRISKSEYLQNKDRYEFLKLNFNTNPGFCSYKDKNNNIFYCSNNDPRVLSRELKPMWCGRRHSNISRKKMSETKKLSKSQCGYKNSQYGTKWVNKDGIDKKIKIEEFDSYINVGWIPGRTSKSLGLIWINKGNEEQYIKKQYIELYINKGWKIGRKISEKTKNRLWMNKDGIKKLVKLSNIDNFLKKGWVFGMKPHQTKINNNRQPL